FPPEREVPAWLGGGGGALPSAPPPAGGAGFALRRPLLLLALLVLVGRGLGAVDQLEEDYRSAVAGTLAGLDDSRVAAVAVGEARGGRVEKTAHYLGVRGHRQHPAARRGGLAAGQED